MFKKKESKTEEPQVKDGKGEKEERMIGKKEGEQLADAKVYYGMIKAGQLFLSYVMRDLRKGVNREMATTTRKRLVKELKKGVISEELVDYYGDKIAGIIEWIKVQEKLAEKQRKERAKQAKKDARKKKKEIKNENV